MPYNFVAETRTLQMPDHLEIVSDMTRILARSRDLTANFRGALDALRDHLGLGCAFLLIHNPETDRLVLTAASGLDLGEFRKLDSRVDRTRLRSVFDEDEPLRASNISQIAGLDLLASAGDKAVSLPVELDGKPRGTITALYLSDDERRPLEIERLLAIAASLFALSLRIENAVRGEREKLLEENAHLKIELRDKYDFSHIVGNSGAMRQVYDQVTQVARSNATVLLRGESGTGKELVAGAIHYNSLRAKGPFIKVNCAALPDTLVESELFGYERGAFTGADKLRKGRFELADGGTLFLDEIGDLPPQTQVKLLRAIQEREVQRLGGTETVKTNIRLVTATNKNLEALVATGDFREDLYYRLNVFTIYLPPLRERKSDILLLAEHFLEKYEREHEKRVRRISTPAIDMLTAYHFPGNVRELENVIERAVLVCDSNVIHGHHLPPTLQTAELSGTETHATLASAVAAFERDLIVDTLKSTSGVAARAALRLGTTERILNYKIRKYAIDARRFRRND
jgi:Nif-specific regulatory protein